MPVGIAKGQKNKKIALGEAKATLAAVKDVAMDRVIGEVGTLQVTVQDALADLSAKLTGKIGQIRLFDEAIELKEKRLKELHGIEGEAVTLDDMRAQKEAEQLQWDEDRAKRDLQRLEEDAQRTRELARTSSEREYENNTRIERENAAFVALVADHMREESVRQEIFDRGLNDRENAMKAREQEFADLQTKVAGFDAKLASEVSKAESVLRSTLKSQYDHEIAMLKKDNAADAAAHLIETKAMQTMVADLKSQIESLQTQLNTARADAKEVASEALKASSGRMAMDAMQGVVNSQSNTGKTK